MLGAFTSGLRRRHYELCAAMTSNNNAFMLLVDPSSKRKHLIIEVVLNAFEVSDLDSAQHEERAR